MAGQQIRDLSMRTGKIEPVVGTGRFAAKIVTATTVLLLFSVARIFFVTLDPVAGKAEPRAVWEILTSLDGGSYLNLVLGSIFIAPWAAGVCAGLIAWFLFRLETPFYFFDSRWLIRGRTALLLPIAFGGMAAPWLLAGPWPWRLASLASLVLVAVSNKYTTLLALSASAGQFRGRAWNRQFTFEFELRRVAVPAAMRLRLKLVNCLSRADFPDYGSLNLTRSRIEEVFDLTKELRDEAARAKKSYRKLRMLLKRERARPATELVDLRNSQVTRLINNGRAADASIRLMLLDRRSVIMGHKGRRLRLRLRALRLWASNVVLNRAGVLLALVMLVSGVAVVANPVPWVPEECLTVSGGERWGGYVLADSGSVLVVLQQDPVTVVNVPAHQVTTIADGPCP